MSSPTPDVLMTTSDVAAMLQVSQNTLRNMRHQRRVPFLKLAGGAVRYRRSEIEQWIATGAHPARPVVALPSGRPGRRSA